MDETHIGLTESQKDAQAAYIKKHGHCPTCGASGKTHRITITPAVVKTLIKLRRLQHATGKKEIWLSHDDKGTELELTFNERSNMSRLRFLNLARYTESHSGRWFVTRNGNRFLNGQGMPKEVWVFRNRILDERRTEELVTISDIFRKKREPVPYYEPELDQAPTTRPEQEAAVERKQEQNALFDMPAAPAKRNSHYH